MQRNRRRRPSGPSPDPRSAYCRYATLLERFIVWLALTRSAQSHPHMPRSARSARCVLSPRTALRSDDARMHRSDVRLASSVRVLGDAVGLRLSSGSVPRPFRSPKDERIYRLNLLVGDPVVAVDLQLLVRKWIRDHHIARARRTGDWCADRIGLPPKVDPETGPVLECLEEFAIEVSGKKKRRREISAVSRT